MSRTWLWFMLRLWTLRSVVPTASNLVTFAISGPAGVVGVGNGDPASHEPDRASQRKRSTVGARHWSGQPMPRAL